MAQLAKQFSTVSLCVLIIACSGCSISHHHPKVEILGSGKAVLRYEDGPLKANGLPCIEASINGVTGMFLVDTGANFPYLTKTGADRCRIVTSENVVKQIDMYYDPKSGMREAKNVILEFGSGVKVQWSKAMVDERKDPWFGLIDYRTLKALRAVIDTNNKTITISR